MNAIDHQTLFASLENALEVLHRNRTADPHFVAAFDALKQSRATLARLFVSTETPAARHAQDLAAA